MRSSVRRSILVVLSFIVVASFLGCGRMATAPDAPVVSSSAAVANPGHAAESDGLISTIGGLLGDVVGLLFKTLQLVGSLGGSLTNGRWKVVIPAGAVDGNATVSLGVTSSTASDCQLEISPADKNHFDTPATLTIDCRNVSSDQLKGYVIRWLDPSTGEWVAVAGSKVDLTAKTVSAPLQHFSRYSVGPDPDGGKAGW
jgi:hypothetical protein